MNLRIAKTYGSVVGLGVARRDLVLPRVAVAYFLTLKLVYALFVPPNIDEAYYWLWGAHLQWSYLDHAPLVGWAAAGAVSGRVILKVAPFPGSLLTSIQPAWFLTMRSQIGSPKPRPVFLLAV